MKMTMKKFEKTAKDKAMDKAGAKKAGTSVKKYEGSKTDRKEYKAAISRMNKGKK